MVISFSDVAMIAAACAVVLTALSKLLGKYIETLYNDETKKGKE